MDIYWAYALLKQMEFVQRKATTAKSKHAPADFAALKETFLDDMVGTVSIKIVPSST